MESARPIIINNGNVIMTKSNQTDYYDYVIFESDGSLTFGTNEGNYVGGVTSSEACSKSWETSGEYWHRVICNLVGINKYQPEFLKK
jgi:hypothetical protein